MKRILAFLAFVLATQILSAQELTVKGQVVSGDDDYALPGVSVVVKGTMRGTFTDGDGNYTISLTSGQTLVFSCIGYLEHQQIVTRGADKCFPVTGLSNA